jgi:hypothetical protein
LYDLLTVPLLALHLLSVNVAGAGPLVCLWLEWKESRGDPLAGRTATYLGGAAFWALLAGGLLGVVIGALHWSDKYAQLWLETMRYKAVWGLGEYGFSLALAGGYALARRGGQTRWRGLRYVVLLLNGTNLLYHFPFLFSVATNVYLSGENVPVLRASEFRHWMIEPDVLARVVHVVLASFAVTGIMLLGYALRVRRLGGTESDAHRVARWGGWIALVPSLAQIPVGLWLVVALPQDLQARVLGGDVAAVVLLGTSVVLAIFLLQDLAAIALGDVQRKYLMRSMLLMVLVVVLMTGVLRRIRPLPILNTSVGGTSAAKYT